MSGDLSGAARTGEGRTEMLRLTPISLAEANAFVAEHHRHHRPVTGHKFSVACSEGDKVVGVAIVGRPVSRYLDDGWTLEVNRIDTGKKRGCPAGKCDKYEGRHKDDPK